MKPGNTYNRYLSPTFLLLLLGNFYCIYYYVTQPKGFDSVIWIYWFQSVIIGLFNFLDLLTVKSFDTGGFKINGAPMKKDQNGCMAFFFLIHYGIFHFVYGIFLATQIGVLSAMTKMVFIGIIVFLIESLVDFRHRKQMEKTRVVNFGYLFFLPYLRVIPMHLFILVPVFLGITGSILFLLLKFLADILSFFIYRRIFKKSVIL